MACCTFASAQANNQSKTTQSLPAQRNCATTTTPSARVSTLVKKDDFAPRSIADEGIEMFEVSKRFPYTPRRFQRKTVALANKQEPQLFHHAPRTRHRNFQPREPKKKSKPQPSTCQQESPHPGRFRQGEPAGSRVPRPPAANELLPKKEGLCTLSVAKVQNGVSPEAQVAPNSVHRRKCVRTALHTALGSTRLNAFNSEQV